MKNANATATNLGYTGNEDTNYLSVALNLAIKHYNDNLSQTYKYELIALMEAGCFTEFASQVLTTVLKTRSITEKQRFIIYKGFCNQNAVEPKKETAKAISHKIDGIKLSKKEQEVFAKYDEVKATKIIRVNRFSSNLEKQDKINGISRSRFEYQSLTTKYAETL